MAGKSATPFLPTLCLPLLLAIPDAFAAELRVTIDNITSDQGELLVAIVASEAAFNGSGTPTLSVKLPPREERLFFSTNALPRGTYGIRVMHDENGNGEMDSNLVGMPTEGWGFSNNAMGNFGPPGWQDVRFELTDEIEQVISLNH
ncbi:MAG: DUF2141 domain-containing protein [Pseudomonadota bacterium]